MYVRQLTFETLHLCDKYDVCDSIPKLLSSLDEVNLGPIPNSNQSFNMYIKMIFYNESEIHVYDIVYVN